MKALIDLHTHALSSGHAYSTVKENIEYAKINNLKYYGISDHGINIGIVGRKIKKREILE